jgi:hypothetical protein
MSTKKFDIPRNLYDNPVVDSFNITDSWIYPTYFNFLKIQYIFSQLFGDIQSYSKSQSKTFSQTLGITAKTGTVLNFFAELAGSIELKNENEKSNDQIYKPTDLLRFVIIRKYLRNLKVMKNISTLTPEEWNKPHIFIEDFGEKRLFQDTYEIIKSFTPDQSDEILKRKKIEETIEGCEHRVICLGPSLKFIAIIANKFYTMFSPRYLNARYKYGDFFFGQTISEDQGLVFVDPYLFGHESTILNEWVK